MKLRGQKQNAKKFNKRVDISQILRIQAWLGMVAYAFNSSPWEAQVERARRISLSSRSVRSIQRAPEQPELHRQTSKKYKRVCK